MKLAILASILGVVFSNPWSKLDMAKSWKEEYTYDWDNLDHVLAFYDWQKEFGKKYKNLKQESQRFLIFLDNWKLINKHNLKENETYKMGLNQFSDLTSDEFRQYVHGNDGSCLKYRSVDDRVNMKYADLSDVDAPSSIDWTNVNGKSYVTPVKNQEQCGSCWAFSATGSIEARTAIKEGKTGSSITELSEQQLVDCSGSYGNYGCNGGLMDNAFKYVEHSGGLCTEKEYPYTARNGNCKSSSCGKKYDAITRYYDVQADSEESLINAVAQGPVSIGIEADQTAFQHYRSGVLTGSCGTRIDHGVLAVGYGTSGSTKYWKVKNSWGSSWGENGYVLICRECNKNGNKGECGILETPSYPVAE